MTEKTLEQQNTELVQDIFGDGKNIPDPVGGAVPSWMFEIPRLFDLEVKQDNGQAKQQAV